MSEQSERMEITSTDLLAFADSVRNALYVLSEVVVENTDSPNETPEYLDKFLDVVDKSVERLQVKPSVLRAYAADILKYGKPLDSGLPSVLERVDCELECTEHTRKHREGCQYCQANTALCVKQD